jgi:HEAT repeat protein
MMAEHDLGLLSQYELCRRSAADSPYEMAADSGRNPTARLLDAADMANACNPKNIKQLQRLMRDRDCAVRRWAAIGLMALKTNAIPAVATLARGLTDDSPDVQMTCAEALAGLGHTNSALPVLVALLTHESSLIRAQALLALARIGPAASEALPHLDQALDGGGDRNVWAEDNVPNLVKVARSAIADPDPDTSGALPKEVPLKARRQHFLP